MSQFLSSPTPTTPSGSAPLVDTPPLLGSPAQHLYSDGDETSEVDKQGAQEPAGANAKVPPRQAVVGSKSPTPAHTVPPPTAPVPAKTSPPRVARSASTSVAADDGSGSTSHHGSIVPAYPYNVAMAPSAFVGGPLPDDSEVTTRLPSICVDYLSHDWAEDDVWTSWKAMTRHKAEIANGVRLENASWRTWAKQRGKLKTVSPETLNWLKDSDVTWLYGPLHTAVDAVPPPREATANERLGLESLRTISDSKKKATAGTPPTPDTPQSETLRAKSEEPSSGGANQAGPSSGAVAAGDGKDVPASRLGRVSAKAPTRRKKSDFHAKPILKYRSLSDILLPHGQPASPDVEATSMDFGDQATISVHHARSDSHLVRLNSLNRGKSGGSRRGSPIGSPMSSSPERTASDSSSGHAAHSRHAQHLAQKKKERRHISFNHRVEQCIAIDSSEDNRSSTYSTASSSDEDEDDVLTFGARSPRLSSYMRSGAAAAAQPKEPHTIARLGPTTLKSVEMYPAPSPAVVFSSDPTEYDPDGGAASSPPAGSYGQQLVEEADYDGSVGVSGSRQPQAQQQAPQSASSNSRRVIYDYSTAESQARSQWDVDDEDYAMGFDYFTGPPSGPDVGVGDEYDMAQYGSTHLIGGTHNNYGVENVGSNDPYLGHGPYSPSSPYHPGTSTLEPSVHATAPQIPHYRDTLNTSSNSSSNNSASDVSGTDTAQPATGPHQPPSSARDAEPPKRSAMKGGRSREPSTESAGSSSPASSSAPSPPLSSLSSSPTGIQAIATAIPAHVRPAAARRASSEEGERGRSASRGSSSSLEREASAARRSSTSISPAAYSPPSMNGGAGFFASSPPTSNNGPVSSATPTGAKPIAIEPTWKVAGSYESLDSVLSGGSRGPSSYTLDRQAQDGSSGAGAYGMGRIITSSSVDSMGSLGSFGAGPITPTSPTFASPSKRFQPPLPSTNGALAAGDDDDDDDKLVEDVDADSRAKLLLPIQKVNSSSNIVEDSADVTPMNAPSTHNPAGDVSASSVPPADHARPAAGPKLRNPSASAPSPAVSSEPVPAQAIEAHKWDEDDAGSSGLLKRTTSSSSLSFARQSLLRATRDTDESSPRSSLDSSEHSFSGQAAAPTSVAADARSSIEAPTSTTSDDLGVADAGVGSGINVAGTARDLLGALSKGIWGSLGGGNRQNSR